MILIVFWIIFGKTGKSKPQLKRYKSDAAIKGEVANTWWDDCGTATEATQELIKIFSKEIKPFLSILSSVYWKVNILIIFSKIAFLCVNYFLAIRSGDSG